MERDRGVRIVMEQQQYRKMFSAPDAELWRELDALAALHDVKWHWVKGHNGHPGNERADALANRGVETIVAPGTESGSDTQ
jgi:ribonuclease HI